jgi:hypothetical protein
MKGQVRADPGASWLQAILFSGDSRGRAEVEGCFFVIDRLGNSPY